MKGLIISVNFISVNFVFAGCFPCYRLRQREHHARMMHNPEETKRRKSTTEIESYYKLLEVVNESVKENFATLKAPFESLYSLLINMSSQVRNLALWERNESESIELLALKQPSLLNHFLVMQKTRSVDEYCQVCNTIFSNVSRISETADAYRNVLSILLPMVAGLDADSKANLAKQWLSPDGLLLKLFSTNSKISFILAGQLWNFSFFLVKMACQVDLSVTIKDFFAKWYATYDRYRFVVVEMFFAEFLFFADYKTSSIIAKALPTDLILQFISTTNQQHAQSRRFLY